LDVSRNVQLIIFAKMECQGGMSVLKEICRDILQCMAEMGRMQN
jgi:hypothetical protein